MGRYGAPDDGFVVFVPGLGGMVGDVSHTNLKIVLPEKEVYQVCSKMFNSHKHPKLAGFSVHH